MLDYVLGAFGKHAILPEEAVHNLWPGYMEAEYRTYENEKEKGMGNDCINFWYIPAICIITFTLSNLMKDWAKKMNQ